MIISRFIQLLDLMIISLRIQALDHHLKNIVMIINDYKLLLNIYFF